MDIFLHKSINAFIWFARSINSIFLLVLLARFIVWHYLIGSDPELMAQQFGQMYSVGQIGVWCKTGKSMNKMYTQGKLQKLADILQTACLNVSLEWKLLYFFIRISLQCVTSSPHDNKFTLIPVVAWCCTGTKPLPDPMLIQIINTDMHHRLQYVKGVQCVKSSWNQVGLD